MSDELYDAMKGQRFEAFLNICHYDSDMLDRERSLIFISISLYLVYTLDPVLYYVDTGASIT